MVKNKRIKHKPHLKFKAFLVENQITQKEIASFLGISEVTLSHKMIGYLHFSFNEVERICMEYDIKPEIFLTYKFS